MIGVGIAGAGYFAALHAKALEAVPAFRLVAASAGRPEHGAAFVARHGGRAVADWRALLDDREVDVILIAAPHHLHAPMAVAAAGAGKHVILEKPMAPTLAACRDIAAAFAASGTKLLVAQIMRYSLTLRAARDVLRAGTLGRPLFGRSALIKCWMEANRQPWHLAPETGGGMLLTAGIHALDRLVWLMGATVREVAAMGGHLFHDQRVPDTEALLLGFEGGGIGQLASVGYRDVTSVNDTEIACEGGALRLDFTEGVSVGRGGAWERLANTAEPDFMLRALEREWREMRDALEGGGAISVGAVEAAELIACIEAAGVAAREGRTVRLA